MKREELSSKARKLTYSLAVLNAVVIGLSFLLVKMTLQYAAPLDTLTYRFAAAFVIMIFPVGFRLVKLHYRGKRLHLLLLLASFYPVGYFMLQTCGLQYATSAEGGIISAFTPVATMTLASLFLKEAITLLQKLFILLSTAGVSFIFVMKGSSLDLSQTTGIVLLILACLVFAGYSVLARVVTREFSPTEISCFMVGTAFLSLLVYSLTTHSISGTVDAFFAPLANGTFLALIFCLGAIQLVTALLANYILSKIEASKMSVFANLSTVVSIAAGAIFLQETITWYHLFGSALIIAGVIGSNVSMNKIRSQPRIQPQRFE
ncbi:DMT family transporter [Brevibacillus choshinensis]|nr:DMT family transporter [Brevibacillus choshinensis]